MTELLCVFAKAPVAGRVKTRLVPPLDDAEAADVAEACLHDVVALATSACGEVVLFHDPEDGSDAYFRANFPHVESRRQVGADLGERLTDALDWAVARGADRVCILGGDVPTVPPGFLAEAFDLLERSDAVLGPVADGGYYLVGVRAKVWPRAGALFTEIAWSTASVFAETVEAARAAGIRCAVGQEWYDIDRVEDLRLAARDMLPGSRLATLLEGSSEIVRKMGGFA